MRSIIFTFGGTPTPLDLLMVSYTTSRGGRSTAKVFIGEYAGDKPSEGMEAMLRKGWKPATSIADAVGILAAEINGASSEWCPGAGDFKASAKGTRLMVMASTLTDDATFQFDVEGARTETCEIEVLG